MTERIVDFTGAAERQRWNEFVFNSPQSHLLQTCQWGDFKAALGWRVYRLGLEREGQLIAGAQMLIRPLAPLPLSIAYIPKGPLVNLSDQATANILWGAIHQTCRRHGAIFLKIEPNLLNDDGYHQQLQHYGFQPSAHTNQPRSTIIVNLSSDEEMMLARMRRKTRQLIRQADRTGVKVVEGSAADLPAFYQILTDTAAIKDFPVHDRSFYEQAWQTFAPAGWIKLLLAKHQGQVVAAKMLFVFGQRSLHFWGGTARAGREINASYLIQWEALRLAAARGCHYADLWGIPDELADMLKNGQEIPQERQQGGLWGVYTFKRGFGGEFEAYVGAYDYVYMPWLYWLGINVLARNHTLDTLLHWVESIRG